MRIFLNGTEREVADGLTVAGLLDTLDVSRRYVAVERNREIVRRAEHDETVLADGDHIEIVTMVGGG